MQQWKSGFKCAIDWNKYQSKTSTKVLNWYLDYLTDPIFQRVNKLFVLTFDVNANRFGHSRYFLLTIKIEDCNVLIDVNHFFNQPTKNDVRTYESIWRITIGQGDY